MCVQVNLVMDILSNNKIAFQIATKKQIWENTAMLFDTSRAESTTPSAVPNLKTWKPTQQYKNCPSVVHSSLNLFFFYIYQSVLAVVLSKTKLAYSSISMIFFFNRNR